MSRNRFVQPEIVRLPLSDGDFIDVKKELTHGERDHLLGTMRKLHPDGVERFDSVAVRTAELMAYLLGWSFVRDGVPVPMSPTTPENERRDAINGLSVADFDEVYEALKKHVQGLEAEREAAKNGQSTPTASVAI